MSSAFPGAVAYRADLILAYGWALWALLIAPLCWLFAAGLRIAWRTLGPGQPAVPRYGGLTPRQARAWQQIEEHLAPEMEPNLIAIRDEMEREDGSA